MSAIKFLSVLAPLNSLLILISVLGVFICQLANFKEFKWRSGSEPTAAIIVLVSYDNETLRFLFKKGSRDKNYYWGFLSR